MLFMIIMRLAQVTVETKSLWQPSSAAAVRVPPGTCGRRYPITSNPRENSNGQPNLRTEDHGPVVRRFLQRLSERRGQALALGQGHRRAPYQLQAAKSQIFAKGSWGGTFHDDFQVQPGDIVATEHWASSGFPNTDLDHQLKRHGKEKIICIGLLANTCLEATARVGMELGYHVTYVRDATAARSPEAMHAAVEIDAPTYAHEIPTTAELVAAIKASTLAA
jgi:nicotinamidase-related amidase